MKPIGLFVCRAACAAVAMLACLGGARAASSAPVLPQALPVIARADAALAAGNAQAAFVLYRNAAASGSVAARYRLGMMRMLGVGTKPGLNRAYVQFRVDTDLPASSARGRQAQRNARFELSRIARYHRAGFQSYLLREDVRCVIGGGRPPFAALSHCVAKYGLPGQE